MLRRLLAVAWLLSFSLFVVAGAMWIRSLRVCDQWQWVRNPGRVACISRGGFLIFHRDTTDHATVDSPPLSPGFGHDSMRAAQAAEWPVEMEPDWQFAGFAGTAFTSSDWLRDRVWELRLPYWALATICLALAALTRSRNFRRARRRRAGHCTHCGYDLRASTGRCPECGTTIPEGRREHSSTG